MAFKRLAVVGACVLLALGMTAKADAGTVKFEFGSTYSGTSPTGSPSWLQAVFSDGGLNLVDLWIYDCNAMGATCAIGSGGLQGGEFLSDFFFNVNPTYDPNVASLGISIVGTNMPAPGWWSVTWGTDCCKAGPDGKYDFNIRFPLGPPSDRFDSGKWSHWRITGPGLTAADFDFFSTYVGGADDKGPFKVAGHVQGIGAGAGSGWVTTGTIPEPAVLLLLGAGLAFSARGLRRRA